MVVQPLPQPLVAVVAVAACHYACVCDSVDNACRGRQTEAEAQ